MVRYGSRLLQMGECYDDLDRHLLLAHWEVLSAPLRLCSPVFVTRNFNFTDRIFLYSI